MNNTLKTNEQGDTNMTTHDEKYNRQARLKKAWQRRYHEMIKAGFSEAIARMEADDYMKKLDKEFGWDIL
tara:strand:- start:335 stop:544 length:210 start_codon:yes stop_codon:yes gene_type:complete